MEILGIVLGAIFGIGVLLSIILRVVVPTNMVHIVQSKTKVVSYGKSKEGGNVYWAWPSWVPVVGVLVTKLPVKNFDLSLNSYDAYDKDKVPFVVDITAFFRIADTNKAAQNIEYVELQNHLKQIVQGAVRTILASYTIDDIMLKRETFGDAFTKAVAEQLKEWGVEPVKNLELMDIRDAKDSHVIDNIMARKKSFIERESRVEVAENMRAAQEAEILAQQEVELKRVSAAQQVGERTAEKDRLVGIAQEKNKQAVAEEAATTAEKDMEVLKVTTLRQAAINKEQAEIGAAEAAFKADAIRVEGEAEAEVRAKIFAADNALDIRLKAQKETAIGVAEALAKGNISLVPNVYIGGASGTDPTNNNAMDTLVKLMTMNVATNVVSPV